MGQSSYLLSKDGPFAKKISHFIPRHQQQVMAEAIESAIAQQSLLLIEAGTGIGKTFAYLVPVMAFSGRVIISTGTRQLQDQLFLRDIPNVLNTLNIYKEVTLLKGRSNYLCGYRLNEALLQQGFLKQKSWWQDLLVIKDWAETTEFGDIAECSYIGENSIAWSYATSTSENCLGSECSYYNDCFLVKARKKALQADIIVINHHLLSADINLKQDSCGEILPKAEAFIIDEAHQLPDIASHFLGRMLSTKHIAELAQDILVSLGKDNLHEPLIFNHAREVEKTLQHFLFILQNIPERGTQTELHALPQFKPEYNALIQAVENLYLAVSPQESLNKAWAALKQRIERQLTILNTYNDIPEDIVGWYYKQDKFIHFNLTPISIQQHFAAYTQEQNCSFIFTSATLTVANDFKHFSYRLGLKNAINLHLDSPFDYQKQALLYTPSNMPDPQTPQYIPALVQSVLPVLKASGGRAFILFTSYRALEEAYYLLYEKIHYPLFVQGQSPRSRLLEQFCNSGNGVLLGTGSFWEGVDVPGSTLSCVIIEKLPFASPSDPVIQARIKHIRNQGKNPFNEYQLPQAVIHLKQGVGRLIRSISDRGILMVADPRLFNRTYGKVFRESLPNFTYTKNIQEVELFFRK